MIVAKQIADLFTFIRALLCPTLILLGLLKGAEGLPLAIATMIISWTSDALDGPIARRSRVKYHTWLGDHDLEVDILVSVGLMVYMLLAGFIDIQVVGVYILLWILIIWRWGHMRSLGMLFQAPIYGLFIYVSMRLAPETGAWMIGWILAVTIITWPRFPNEVVPGFLEGMKDVVQVYLRKEQE
jgi:phosphatidylglycerophosphate synthase